MQSMNHLIDDGYALWVFPSTWTGMSGFGTNQSKLEYFKNFAVHSIDFTATSHFSVGIRICSMVLQKSSRSVLTKIKTEEDEFTINLMEYQALPMEPNRIKISILNKILQRNGKLKYSFKESVGANEGLPKVYLLNSIRLGFNHLRIDSKGNTSDTWKISMILSSQDIGAESVFKNKLGRFYMLCTGESDGMIGVTTMKHFPNLDLTRIWTDQEIYAHFNLTQEEIEYIEGVVR